MGSLEKEISGAEIEAHVPPATMHAASESLESLKARTANLLFAGKPEPLIATDIDAMSVVATAMKDWGDIRANLPA